MKKLVLSLLFVMQVVCAWAQQASVQGKVVDSKSQKPVENVVATLEATGATALTNAEGVFVFPDVAAGSHVVTVGSTGFVTQTFTLEVAAGQTLDIGVVSLEYDITSEQQLSLITITDNDLGDDNSGSENTAGLLQASRDIFQQAAAFNWGMARFRIRGLDNEYGTTMINGVTMNKLYDGRPNWSNWGGLNDATRNQEFTMGTAASDYTFGSILGTQEINTRASIFRPGGRISFSGTNTNYNWRAMATYASGMDKNGWAYVISASTRMANEGYFEGTDYKANSFFASVEKKINDKHSINFTGIYAQNSRGKNSPNTDEMTRIAGEKYNSYWGYQNGDKRNSRDKDVEEPIFMLSHYWNISESTSLNTNVAYQFGKIGNSRLDYQNAPNPDPTYYRNLPSYFTSMYDGATFIGGSDENVALAKNAPFLTNRQIDWNNLYQTNSNTANGRSAYVLYEDRTDDKTLTANSILRSQLSDHISLNAGATYKHVKSHNFQNLLDLLGGQFFEDFDNYYTGSYSQSDLNNPNRTVRVGDTYGYNYNLFANNIDAFTQFKFSYSNIDFYLAQNFSRSEYQREGLYRNGLYANNSYGKSNKAVFENYGFKGGLTYKLDGRNMIVVNAARMTKAPTLRNTFPNARLNNVIVDNIGSELVSSADLSYVIRTPKLKARITGYYSTIQNSTETSFFFGEGVFDDNGGDGGNAFIAETVTGINKQMMGGELGIEYNITQTIKVNASAAFGQYTYTNNPNVSVNNDALAVGLVEGDGTSVVGANTGTIVDFGKAYLKDYKLAGMPQQAYSLGLEYRDPHFWWIGANANYLAQNYIDVSALLRTANFFKDPVTGQTIDGANTPRARELLKQERFNDFYLFNLQGGKSWRLGKQTVGFFASVNNVFDKTYKTGGFEQSRNANYTQLDQDQSSGTPSFGSKYFYGYGRTFFVNLYINF
ncbi:TonB-dependent receptor [Flavobacterium rivuli WB 3.3-2 = DSM 21788]|uniref:TonB-dependent receptor n=1 Tax=Flavobacterium rivuli WB 3.3-2 = DSM 21788 TaxID=1121895 RepID=A0A0A2LYA5_9FLAO|nr:TonB-dependent receptor [Flavobacterium rivuli]KGO85372.1 TonB-dependent receptor [Flavobacterium rivuli WB 3.3-2 = DSM 21788]